MVSFEVKGTDVAATGPGAIVQIMNKEGEPYEEKIHRLADGETCGFSSVWWKFAGFDSFEAAQAAYPNAWDMDAG